MSPHIARSSPDNWVRTLLAAAVVMAITASMLVVFAGPALACSCLDQTELQLFEGADVVFVGTVDEMTAGDTYSYDFTVQSVQKGEVFETATVLVGGSDVEDCLFELSVGTRYQVYAGDGNGALTTGLCSGTHALDAAPAFEPEGSHSPEPTAVDSTAVPGDTSAAPQPTPVTNDTAGLEQPAPQQGSSAPVAAPASDDGGGVPLWVLPVAILAALIVGYGLASWRSQGRGR